MACNDNIYRNLFSIRFLLYTRPVLPMDSLSDASRNNSIMSECRGAYDDSIDVDKVIHGLLQAAEGFGLPKQKAVEKSTWMQFFSNDE